jgi:hypothetical protein
VSLADADHVGDDASFLALRILEDFRRAGPRQMAPGIGAWILTRRRAVVDQIVFALQA